MNTVPSIDNIISLAKRRGFAYPSSDIYGGMANTWDYGHYGTLLKNNIRDLWWKTFVLDRDDMVGIEASIFLNPKVWEASGHVANFTDALIDCKNCKFRTRADHLIEESLPGKKAEGLSINELTMIITDNKLKCPKCGLSNWTDARNFNLLFETEIGIIEGEKSKVYLRGEIAQGIFLNFKNVLNSMRVKVPFGIAQVGKAFRNEITMGQFVHRTLEFDLMEFEYFIHPKDWEATFKQFQDAMMQFALSCGLNAKKLRWREHEETERSHYSKKTIDLEYEYPFGWKELFGFAYRTDFDLINHEKHSGKDLSYTDPKTNEKYIPHVLEPSFGLSRLFGAVLFDSYVEEKVGENDRTVLKLNPQITPIKAAIFPLQKDEKLQKVARDLYTDLKKKFVVEYDDSGNIGKMYRRQDEIGTPFCITVDFETLEDKKVTVRDRDSMKQTRIALANLDAFLVERT